MGSDKCRRRIVSRGSNVQIEICTCSTSVVHVVAGAVTIRMEKKMFQAFADVVFAAAPLLQDDAIVAKKTPMLSLVPELESDAIAYGPDVA